MHYALTHLEKEFFVDNLYKTVSLAPCFVQYLPRTTIPYYENNLMHFQEHGIYSINGPNKEQDKETICEDFSL